ncbi:MAG: hypothetical protein ACE5IJ_11435 [Thermoplasmata archaeon]
MVLESAAVGLVTVLSIALLITSIVAYRRTREVKLAVVALAFSLFTAKGALWTASLFFLNLETATLLILLATLDAAILIAIFVATLRP